MKGLHTRTASKAAGREPCLWVRRRMADSFPMQANQTGQALPLQLVVQAGDGIWQ